MSVKQEKPVKSIPSKDTLFGEVLSSKTIKQLKKGFHKNLPVGNNRTGKPARSNQRKQTLARVKDLQQVMSAPVKIKVAEKALTNKGRRLAEEGASESTLSKYIKNKYAYNLDSEPIRGHIIKHPRRK